MFEKEYSQLAALILRVSLGIMFIAHSLWLKLFVFTLEGTAQYFVSIGLPAWSAYGVFGFEVVAGVMLVLGIQARWVALAAIPILIGATWAHWGNGWMFGYEGGGWEYPLYLTILALVQSILGDGLFALSRSKSYRSISQAISGSRSEVTHA